MPDPIRVTRITSSRAERRSEKRRSLVARTRWAGVALASLLSVLLAVGVIWFALVYSQFSVDLPQIENLQLLLEGEPGQPLEPTRIFASDGQTLLLNLQNPNARDAVYVALEDIPPNMVDATLAASDPDFWQHRGFRFGMNASQPTLAQRLAGEMLLGEELRGQNNDLRLNLLAAQATSEFGRKAILEWYLNSADYGQRAYGVDAAAWVYFGKTAAQLSLAEAAILAATAEAPSLNPIEAPDIAVQRQGAVLQAMLALNLISNEEAINANARPIQVQSAAKMPASLAPDFVDLLLEQLYSKLGEGRVARGGLEVISSLDTNLQEQAQCAASVQLSRLQGDLPLTELGDDECEAARLLPTLNASQLVEAVDLETGVAVLSPESGHILALVGDPYAKHAPGSILTPFIYLTAFTRGLSPATLVWDVPSSLPAGLEDVANHDGEFHGPMRIRTALANDYIVPAMSTLTQIGPANVWRTAQQSGMASLPIFYDDRAYRLVLDTGSVSLLEIAQAYNMLADQGKLSGQYLPGQRQGLISASAIRQVRHANGRVLLDWEQPQQQAVVSAQLAYLLTDILNDDLARQQTFGHPNILEIGRPAAAKTGQILSGDSVWAVGYSPQYTIGVWVGFKNDSIDGDETLEPLAAAGVWHALMKYTHQNQGVLAFEEPLGINTVAVCDPSGLLPTEDCPRVVEELFLSGTEPQQGDNLYRTYLVNQQTGRLATVHTPSEFVDEQVYLVVPPDAVEWARQAGLEVPPEDYDVIFNPTENRGPVSISSPAMFEYVAGQVQVEGQANPEDMAFYRLQIGEGLYPRQWLQIGADITMPVEDGLLVDWDTTGLDGLYAVQLLVVAEDQSVESATIQVTVDNQLPVVVITVPGEEQQFTYPGEGNTTFQAQVTDNIGVARVEFFLDDSRISSLTQPPYAVPWQGTGGEHILRVVATDLAGNQGEATTPFVLAP